MSDYSCEHGEPSMGRCCSKCMEERQRTLNSKEESYRFLHKWMADNKDHVVTFHLKNLYIKTTMF